MSNTLKPFLSVKQLFLGLLLMAGVSLLPFLTAAAQAASADSVFALAKQRGYLTVGVSWQAPAPVSGDNKRTAERYDADLISYLSKQLNVPIKLVSLNKPDVNSLFNDGKIDLALLDLNAQQIATLKGSSIATGYETGLQAIIRGDTKPSSWQQLSGQTVCVANSATQAQQALEQYDLKVKRFTFVSDALVAVREGHCAAAVVDTALRQGLMTYPEWKSYSSTLAINSPERVLSWIVPSGASYEQLQAIQNQWNKSHQWQKLKADKARKVAFDVYMDQDVADCH